VTVVPSHASLGLLGKCDRTIVARKPVMKRRGRLNKPYPTTPQSFGEQLRKQRLDKKLTQLEVAAKIGVSHSSIDKWECDWTTPPARFHMAITAFLGFDPFDMPGNPTAE
jgi:DNA-binding XRE family transcriptional regulator